MIMAKLETKIHNITLKNPVMTASGTFGYGEEFADFIDLTRLGGIIVKGTTGERRQGNPYPRMAETPSGMLNAVGLQNVGVENFCKQVYPRIKDIDTNILVNVSGSSIEEYCSVAEQINELPNIPGIELNISCPNVKKGGMGFGTNPEMAAQVVSEVRKVYDKTLIVKLTPNVTSIVDIAKAVEQAGADSVSLINTMLGMAIDVERQRPYLSTITGGLSGPCVKPVAVRMVWEVSSAVKIPVLGMGGVAKGEDAAQMMLAGATAVAVGTALFADPFTPIKVREGLAAIAEKQGLAKVSELTGGVKPW